MTKRYGLLTHGQTWEEKCRVRANLQCMTLNCLRHYPGSKNAMVVFLLNGGAVSSPALLLFYKKGGENYG